MSLQDPQARTAPDSAAMPGILLGPVLPLLRAPQFPHLEDEKGQQAYLSRAGLGSENGLERGIAVTVHYVLLPSWTVVTGGQVPRLSCSPLSPPVCLFHNRCT